MKSAVIEAVLKTIIDIVSDNRLVINLPGTGRHVASPLHPPASYLG